MHLPRHTLSCVPAGAFRIGLAKSDPANSTPKKIRVIATPWRRLHFLKHLLLTPLIRFQIRVLLHHTSHDTLSPHQVDTKTASIPHSRLAAHTCITLEQWHTPSCPSSSLFFPVTPESQKQDMADKHISSRTSHGTHSRWGCNITELLSTRVLHCYTRSNAEILHLPCHTLSCVPTGAFRIGLAKSDPASSPLAMPTLLATFIAHSPQPHTMSNTGPCCHTPHRPPCWHPRKD